MSLLTNLLAHWKADEASGTRADDLGNYDLADHNGVLSAAGLLGNAAQTRRSATAYLRTTAAVFPDVTAGLSVNGWIYPTGTNNNDNEVFSLDTLSGTDRLLRTYWNSSFGGFLTGVLFGSGSSITWNISGGDVPANTWSRIAVWWDPADGKGRLQVNNSAPVVSSGSLVALNAGAVVPINLGNLAAFEALGFDGLFDEFAMWNRAFVTQDLPDLWDGGAPLPYASYGGTPSGDLLLARRRLCG